MKVCKRYAWQLAGMTLAFVFALGIAYGFLLSFMDSDNSVRERMKSLERTATTYERLTDR